MGSIKSLPFILTLQSSSTFSIASSSPSPRDRSHPKHIHSYHQIQMAKQKIVVKVTMSNDKKTRKALKIAVSLSGVESASFVGSDKDQIAVTGEGIDSVELTSLLRKGVGHTELMSVGPVEEKKPEAKPTGTVEVNPYQYYYSYYGTPYYVYEI